MRVHGMIDFDNLSFWNTLNKTHQVILVWNRNKKIVYMKKYVYEERKKNNTWRDRWNDNNIIYMR